LTQFRPYFEENEGIIVEMIDFMVPSVQEWISLKNTAVPLQWFRSLLLDREAAGSAGFKLMPTWVKTSSPRY